MAVDKIRQAKDASLRPQIFAKLTDQQPRLNGSQDEATSAAHFGRNFRAP